MQAEKLNFSRIFQVEGITEHYHIPKFQREYTWKQNNLEALLQDIEENDPGYFIGSIIVVNENTELRAGEEKVYQVIDGQQRLITLSILQAAIYKKYKDLSENPDLEDIDKEDFTVKLSSLRKKLLKTKKEFYPDENGGFQENDVMHFLRIQPSTQKSNLDDYKTILYQIGLLKKNNLPKYFGKRLIAKSFKYFQQQIPNSKNELDNLVNKINSLIFIHISVGSQADAFTLFETLNNRGVPLSPIDIIKNSLLAEMEKQHNQDINASFEKWQNLLEYIPDFDNQIRFLRQFYNAFKVDDAVKQDKISKATRSNILQIYDKLIKKDAQNLFVQFLDKGYSYGKLIETVSDTRGDITELIIELNRVGASPSFTLLLYLLSNEGHLENENTLKEILSFLIKYYVRRNITDTPNTRDLDSINIDVVELCNKEIKAERKITSQLVIQSHLKCTKGACSSINNFLTWLNDDIFLNNSDMTRYLLCKLDSISHNREYNPDLWKRHPNNDTYIWTIEHILPQGKNLPEGWIKMIANGENENATDIQNKWVHKLGNLTLSAYNSNLSNTTFSEKQQKDVKNILKESIFIGYKNGLSLNKISFKLDTYETTLATIPDWNAKAIEGRTQAMVNKIIEIFAFNDEVVV